MEKLHNLVAVSLVFILFFGCTGIKENSNSTAIKFSNYSNDYFSIEYPEDWNKIEIDNKNIDFVSKKESREDLVLETLIIEIIEEKNDLTTFTDFESLEKDTMYEGENITSIQKDEFDGFAALKININGKTIENRIGTNTTTIYLKNNGMVYRIATGQQNGKEAKYQPIFDRMLGSLKIKK